MANATSTQLQELYVAYFGRAADPTGLDYWTEKGITTTKFAADMYAQAEFKDAYGSLSTESQVNQIYQNLFDRDADATGLLYWTKEIDLGNLQLAEIATHLIWAAQNNSGSEDDKTALTNKTNAAVAYTAKVKESTSAILAYQAESTSPWVSGSNIEEAVSYMSGIDKDTESTTAGIAASVTTITNNGVPSLAKNYTLTSGIDDLDGTAGTNKFQAGLTSSGGNTLNSLDTLDGKAGTDTLNATIATSITPGEIKNIENVNLTFEGETKTFNASNMTGVTTLTDLGSTYLGITSNIGSTSTALVVSDNSVGATFTFKASAVTGSADALDLTFSNATSNGVTTITGAIETINLKSSTSANAVRLDSGATTLNITGDADLTFVAASTILDDTTTIDASGASGDISLAHDGAASTAVTITGGSGNDSLTLTGTNTATDTISGGAGDDTLTFTSDLANADVINGGAGTDTLVSTDDLLVGLTTANNVSNIEVLQSSTVLAKTLTTANVDSTISSVKLAAGANAGTVVFGAGTNTLTMGTANAGAMTVNDTGLATNDTLTINASTVDSFNNNAVAINGFETVNFNTGTGSTTAEQNVSTFNVTGDPDSAGTRTAVTLTITGKGNFDASGAITLGTNGSGAGTIDASALTGDLDMNTTAAKGISTITGGSGNDRIVGDSHASTLTGGAGNDTITGGAASDTITGGAGNDTLVMSAGGAGVNDTVTGGAGNDTFYSTAGNLAAGHVLSGGDGTDTLKIDDLTAVTDSQFENNTSIEVLTADATGLSATLDDYAQAMGITTITFAGTSAAGVLETVTIQDGVTNAVTVNIDALNTGGTGDDHNTVDASTYTGVLTITTAAATAIQGSNGSAQSDEVVLTGGTGTSDTLNFHGGTFTKTHLTSVTAIENFVQSDDVSSSITIDELNIADGKTLTIDVRSVINASNTTTIDAIDDTNGILTVHGSTGVDTITGSSSDLGDTIYGYSGSDIIKVSAAQFTTLDTIDAGAGTDVLNLITAAATIADADFTNASNFEKLTFGVASSNTDLGAQFVESGITTITLTSGTNDLNLDSVTTAQTLNLVEGTDTIDASSMTAALTVVYAEGSDLTSGDTITAGSGTSDVLQFTHDTTAVDLSNVTGFETIKSGANTSGFTVTTVDGNVASTKSLTIDTTAQTTNGYTVDISAESDGAVTITGGNGAGTITLSSSSMGDTFTGGSGADGVTVIGAQLTSADTLNGGSATDTLTIGTVGTLSDSDFTNISNFEALVGGDGAITMVLGAEYAAAGFTTHTEFDNGTTNEEVAITYGSGVTTNQTYNMKTSDTTLTATGMTGNLTVAAIEADLESRDTITGGSGTDTLEITFISTASSAADIGSVTSIETYKVANDATHAGFTFADANFVSNNFTVNAAAITTATNTFTVDASAEDDSTMTLTGSAGVDTVTGTAVTATGDTISTGGGADIITGGRGNDTITGGAGADVFTYTAVNQSTGSERDNITDFTSGTDKFAITLDKSGSSAALTFDASVQTARAGTSLIQENMSGSIGQTFYDTTNNRVIVNANADTLVSTLDYQIDVNAAATATSTIAAVDFSYTVTGGSGADTIVVDGGTDTVTGGGGIDKITITDTTASQDTVTLTAGASSVDFITGFTVGGSGDHLLAADATHAWLGTNGSATNDGAIAVGTGTNLAIALINDDNATVFTCSEALTSGILATFEAGTTSEAQLETAAISALGQTSTKLKASEVVMVLVDDATSTAIFKLTSADAIANAINAAEIEVMAVLKGVAAAETVVSGDIVFA